MAVTTGVHYRDAIPTMHKTASCHKELSGFKVPSSLRLKKPTFWKGVGWIMLDMRFVGRWSWDWELDDF